MYRHSPKVFRSFLIGCVLSLIGAVFVALDALEWGLISSPSIAVAVGLVTLFLCQLVNTSRCKKLLTQEQASCLSLLWDRCDPVKFVEHYEPMVRAVKGNDPFALTYRNQLATGYVAKGDYDQANQMFSQVLAARETNSNAQYIRQANLFRCELWFMTGDAEKLEADLEASRELLQRLHEAAKLYPVIRERLERNHHLLNILKGEQLQEAADYFRSAFQRDKAASVKVTDQYVLAAACRRLGDSAQETQALRYVAEHGNTMAVTALAKARLAELH